MRSTDLFIFRVADGEYPHRTCKLASILTGMHHLGMDTDVTVFPLSAQSATPPPGHTVAEALDAYWHSKGMKPPVRENLAALPLWPKDDADAFERVINDMFGRLDEPPHSL